MDNQRYLNYMLENLTIPVTVSDKRTFVITHSKFPALWIEEISLEKAAEKLKESIREELKECDIVKIDYFFECFNNRNC